MIVDSLGSGIRGIVLDAVGTLIDPCPAVAVAYCAAAQRQGIELEPTRVKSRFARCFGQDEIDEARGPLATDEAVEVRRWRRIVAGVLPEVPDPERAFDELWRHFGRASAWRLFPDALPAIRMFQGAGLGLRIASNFDARLRGVLAGMPEVAELSEAVVISSEIGWRKPHPAFYGAACNALGMSPGEVLAIGDDPENDFHGPTRAGLRAVVVDRAGRLAGDLPRAGDLGEIAGWLTGSGLANPTGAGR
jgi:putative hydrolase of the HAD superfamily